MPPRKPSPQSSELSESPLLYDGPIDTNASLANNLNGFSVSLARQEQWLRRSQQWDFADLPIRWAPRKVLGAGVNGIAALFERRGDGQGPTELVVKQSAKNSELMRWESLTMRLCMQAESEHIVKLYKAFYRAGGTGVGPFDPLPIDLRGRYDRSREVSRIYTEYCRNGNMRGLSKWKKESYDDLGETFPEEYIWRFILCLSKALMVLEYGSEDMSTDWGTKIVHFDIKEDNIFIGDLDEREHKRLAIFKLGDFGLALIVPPPSALMRPNLQREWANENRWRQMPGLTAPEQYFRSGRRRHKDVGNVGTPCNVFMLGVLVQKYLFGRYVDMTQSFATKLDDDDQEIFRSFATIPWDKEIPYSRKLINLLIRLLADDPNCRPLPDDIYLEARDVTTFYDNNPLCHGYERSHVLPPDESAFIAPGNPKDEQGKTVKDRYRFLAREYRHEHVPRAENQNYLAPVMESPSPLIFPEQTPNRPEPTHLPWTSPYQSPRVRRVSRRPERKVL